MDSDLVQCFRSSQFCILEVEPAPTWPHEKNKKVIWKKKLNCCIYSYLCCHI